MNALEESAVYSVFFTPNRSAARLRRAAGLRAASNTNVNRTNSSDLEALYEILRGADISAWQVQITAALGRGRSP
jgi:MoaA/NifB/PqqE/SkfB family radical SAM enzyme